MATRWGKPERASGAPSLRHRFAFDKRGAPAADTDYGQAQGDWTEQFTVAGALEARFGGETVMASRLAGRQPFTITVRQSAETRQIALDWQVRNVRTGEVYEISSIADADDSRRFFDILVELHSEGT